MKRHVVEKFSQNLRLNLVLSIGLTGLIGFLVSTGCSSSNSSSPKNSTVSITLPELGKSRAAGVVTSAAATGTPTWNRLMINVSGPAQPNPAVFIWSADQSAAGASPPSNISLSVTQGAGYNVQALAIINQADGTQQFDYGNSIQDLTSSTVPISLNLKTVFTSGTSTAQGAIAGRWLDASGNGPTGMVNVYYDVPGQSKMVVTQQDIVGGWFQWPAFQGLVFDYVLDNGTPLIQQFVLNSTGNLSGQSNMMVSIPQHYRNQNNGYQLDSPWIFQIGYFGPGGPSAGVACYDDNSSDAIQNIYTSATGGAFPWAGATNVSLANSSSAGIATGGVTFAANSTCQQQAKAANTGSALVANAMTFNQVNLSDNNRPLRFSGPYQYIPMGSSSSGSSNLGPMNATVSASTIAVSWQYMPGSTGPNAVTGVEVFVRDLAAAPANTGGGGNPDFQIDGHAVCGRLTDSSFLSQVFTSVAKVSAVGASGLQTYNLTGYQTSHLSNGQLQIVLCPYSANSNHPYLLSTAAYYGGGGGGGGSGGSGGGNGPNPTPYPYQMMITSTAGATMGMNGALNLMTGSCGTFQVNLLSSSTSLPTTSPTDQQFTINVNPNSATAHFYPASAGGCTGGYTSNLSGVITASTSSTTFYYSDSTASFVNLSMMSGNGMNSQLPLALAAIGTPTTAGLYVSGVNPDPLQNSTLLVKGVCYPVGVYLKDSMGKPVFSTVSTGLAVASVAGAFYSNSNCSSSISSVGFTSNTAFHQVYFMATGTVAPGSGTLAASSPVGTLPIAVDDPSTATPALYTMGGTGNGPTNGYLYNQCMSYQIAMVTTYGAIVPPTGPMTFSITSTDPTTSLWQNSACSSGNGSTSSSSLTQSMAPSSGGLSGFTTGNFGVVFGNNTSSNLQISVNGSPFNVFVFRAPDSYAVTYVAGTPNTITVGTNFNSPYPSGTLPYTVLPSTGPTFSTNASYTPASSSFAVPSGTSSSGVVFYGTSFGTQLVGFTLYPNQPGYVMPQNSMATYYHSMSCAASICGPMN